VVTAAATTRVELVAKPVVVVDATVVDAARAVVVVAKPVVVVDAPGILFLDAAAIASTLSVRFGNGLYVGHAAN
jgi:hypothetical protein